MAKPTQIIGYLGPAKSTNGYTAAEKFFSRPFLRDLFDLQFEPHRSHIDIIEDLALKKLQYGVVAIENVIDGIVVETIRCLERNASLGVNVCGEVGLQVRHTLLSKSKTLAEIRTIISHSVALAQCRKTLNDLFPVPVRYETAASTGAAAKRAAEAGEGIAALAKPENAPMFGLNILKDDLADFPGSITRFWVLHNRNEIEVGSKDVKTCILVNLEQKSPGALYATLGYFARAGINVSMLYPCPIPNRKWQYTFVIELQASIYDPKCYEAYVALRDSGVTTGAPTVIGCYHDSTRED